MRVLVSRTDRIGDMVLTLPLCALLAARRDAEVIVLARSYTRAVLEASPYVHGILEWDQVAGAGVRAQRALLASARADVVLHVYPQPAVARAALAVRVPVRIGTSHRWYHWLTCNGLEHFGRRRSPLHEAQLNVRLARRLLGGDIPTLATLAPLTRLVPQCELPADVAGRLDTTRTIVVLHPGSSGSGREWPLDHWRALVESLDHARVQLLVTGTREEGEQLRPLLASLAPRVTDLTGRLSLAELIALLARVDGLVAAGTGPLHLAAGAGAHALGLFPPTPPIHAARWAPLGPRAEYLTAPSACPAHDGRGDPADCGCMREITVACVRDRVHAWADARAR